jgi:GH24 family phage-related lysozyme (muramidase)
MGGHAGKKIMQISNTGLNLIKMDEGFKPRLYNCPAHDASIGYGHLVHHGPVCGAASEAPFAGGITEAAATVLLLEDAAYANTAPTRRRPDRPHSAASRRRSTEERFVVTHYLEANE